ncbi:MAG: L,D-transpeptidase family protein [Rubellimicrobium sp.]|nr:L,D-transpeptidase family protein [Rubellimicrobium sp.]
MLNRRSVILAGAAALAGCAGGTVDTAPRFLAYDGPPVTGIVAWKARRQMAVLSGDRILRSWHFELGFNPVGHKQFEGDGKTPEGQYVIDRKNPRSAYHLSVGVSYPNDADRAYAREMGRRPGGDIFFHGTPREMLGKPDWTAGCLAITNEQVEELYAMIPVRTPVLILA